MVNFIQCDDGSWVNLDHVVKIFQQCKGPVLFCDAEGSVLGRKTGDEFDVNVAVAPVVAAAAGTTAIIITVNCCDTWPSEIDATCVPIIAWRLAYDAALPILIEEPMPGERVFITLPDGRLMEPGSEIFNTLADAQAAVLREWQDDWDRNARRCA